MATFTGTGAGDHITETDMSPGVLADPPGSRPTDADDLIDGRGGNDFLDGSGGSDTLIGDSGDDTLIGGAGIDTASYATATSRVVVDLGAAGAQDTYGAGVDQLIDVENLVGSAFGDILTGTAAAESIDGGGGSDTIYGGPADGGTSVTLGGADTLFGGAGDDLIFAATDVGLVDGGSGRDILVLDGDDDVTVSLAASHLEVVLSGNGDDTLDGTASGGRIGITGGGGSDSIIGGAVGDTLSGGAGDDTITGGGGRDRIDGGEGSDDLDGGSAIDRVSYGSATGGVTVSLADTGWQDTGGGGIDRLSRFEILEGSIFDDSLTGTAAADTLLGDTGNDTLDAAAGADLMIGGSGNDVYFVDDAGDRVREQRLAGSDTVVASVNYTLESEVETLLLIGEAVEGTGNSSSNLLLGNDADNRLSGLDNNDILDGGGGNDTLFGGSGTDWLVGGTGNDFLDGGSAQDTMYGGAGDDIYQVDSPGDQTREEADAGTDTEVSSVTRHLGANLENLVLVGPAAVDGFGNELGNVIIGNAAGNVLSGGGGDDTLAGGGGGDVFRFCGNGGTDLVSDFTHGQDVLDLTGYGLTFADLNTMVVGGNLWIDVAAPGLGASVIVLAGVTSVDESDFLFS